MTYAERAYYDREPCHHVAVWYEQLRLGRALRAAQQAIGRERRGRPRYA